MLGANGGTGVANTSKTITLGGNLTTSGAFATTLTATATTAVTLPTTGTLSTLAGTETLTNKTISGSSNTLSNIANGSLTYSSVTFNGSTVALGGSATITAANPNALTIGTGLSGTSYTGSAAVTVAIDSSVVTLNGTQTLANKTLTSPALGTPSSGNLANCTFPTLNQNTSGTAAGLSATLAIASGGTGQTTAANAGSALGAIGIGQTTQNVAGSRVAGTTYTNSSGRPIMVYISTVNSGAGATTSQEIFVDGIEILFGGTQSNRRAAYTFIVPAGSTYSLTTGDTIQTWCELRT